MRLYVHGNFGTYIGSKEAKTKISDYIINHNYQLSDELKIQYDHTLDWKKKALGRKRADIPEHRIGILFFSK